MEYLKYDKSLKAYKFKNDSDIRHFISRIPLEEYQNKPEKQIYIDYKGVRIVAKGRDINPSSYALSNTFPSKGFPKPIITLIPQAPTREDIFLLPANAKILVALKQCALRMN